MVKLVRINLLERPLGSLQKNSSDFYNVSNYSIYEDNLALNHPAKFIAFYANPETIKKALEINPNISQILKENKLDCTINSDNVFDIAMPHLIPTARLAQKIYCNMGHSKDETNYLHLTQAALLHDIGKAFIPCEILNKKGRLTLKERSIIELHNELSFEILRTTKLNPKVAQLAKEHHNYSGKIKPSHENQAITIADVYCALREKRPYKKPLNDICAKAILYDMGANGKLESKYINLINS